MAKVTGYTKEHMQVIENETVIKGSVNDEGDLILERRDGFSINAGPVRGVKGDPGAGVYDVDVTYQGSTSGTVAPTGEWEDAPPIIAAGHYLWVRTVTTYADPDDPDTSFTIESFIVTRQPMPGADGRGIAGTTVQYQAGVSGVDIPTGSWYGSIPTVPPGQYLWTKTKTTYTDATEDTTYAVSRQGVDGEPGASRYLHVAYAENSDGTIGFSTTDPSGKSYMGIYTDANAADSTDPTKYAWSLIKGAAGAGISGTTTQYQVGTSGTSAPTGEWLESVPGVGENEYLWTRFVMNFTDGAVTTSYIVAKRGDKGAPGVSVSTVTRYYRLGLTAPTAPTTDPPSEEWSLTQPEYFPGTVDNLYLVIQTKLTSGAYSYSPVSLDSSYQAARMAYEAAQAAQDAADEALEEAGNAGSAAEAAAGAALVADTLARTNGERLDIHQAVFRIVDDGAVIASPTSEYELKLKPNRIEIVQNETVVSYWEGSRMVVNEAVLNRVVLGNHLFEKSTLVEGRTTIRPVTGF